MFSCSEFKHDYCKSYFKYEEPVSTDFRVLINGREVPVYTCRISKYPFNRVWPGFQRPVDQTEIVSFVNIVSDEELRLEVLTDLPLDRVLIKPYSKGICHQEGEGRISFTLKENGQYVLECGSYHHCLYIFNSKPIPAPQPDEVTHFFGPGIHFPGKIRLHDNESVYVDKDALVYGCIYAEDAKNIHIFGNGVLDDSHEERTGNYCYEDYTNGNVKFYDCENLRIQGVLLKNSAIWCVNLFHCFDVDIDDIKVFGQWRYNTDGIDIVNSQNIYIRNSFIHSFDDTITIKGIDRYIETNNENIHTENCVLWCDWGKCCEVGVETSCRAYRNISFRNCDILRGGSAALDINNGECADITDVVYENIRIEMNDFDTREQYQNTDEMVYSLERSAAHPDILRIDNGYWRTEECRTLWNLPEFPRDYDLTGVRIRNISNVLVKDIQIFYDRGLPTTDGKPNVVLRVKSQLEETPVTDIQIENIIINGIRAKKEDLIWDLKNVKNLMID